MLKSARCSVVVPCFTVRMSDGCGLKILVAEHEQASPTNIEWYAVGQAVLFKSICITKKRVIDHSPRTVATRTDILHS